MNRRRIFVFLGVFVLAAITSLSYDFLRPAIYRTEARIEVTPASANPAPLSITNAQGTTYTSDSSSSKDANANRPLLTAVEILTSRPVQTQAIAQLKTKYDLSRLDPDPESSLQSSMVVTPVSGTNVVELAITGKNAEILAPLLNSVIQVFQAGQDESYGNATRQALASASNEVARLEADVATKRGEVEQFALHHDIASSERNENQELAGASGLSTSLSKANENVEVAEGRLHSLQDAAATGNVTLQPKDDPTLAAMEQSASQLRQDLTQMARGVTPQFLDMDPVVRAKRAQLADLEQQIKAEQVVGQRAAIASAEQELMGARETLKRLKQQDAQGHTAVRKFSANFDQYKALKDDLDQVQALYRSAAQRKLRLEASELERKPAVSVLEPATLPLRPWRPLYVRDAAISVGGSFVLALLAMWFVELFNRPDPQPAFIIGQPVSPVGMLQNMAERLPLTTPALGTAGSANQAYLPSQPAVPRELRQDEITALLETCADSGRLGILLLLSGVRPEEALTLTLQDVDLSKQRITIYGDRARELSIGETLAALLAQRLHRPGDQLVADAQGHQIGSDQLAADLLCTAHDAGLTDPAEITPAALWHTYVAYLVRQGIRFAELRSITGSLSSDLMASYSRLSPIGSRLSLEEIQQVLPAVAKWQPIST